MNTSLGISKYLVKVGASVPAAVETECAVRCLWGLGSWGRSGSLCSIGVIAFAGPGNPPTSDPTSPSHGIAPGGSHAAKPTNNAFRDATISGGVASSWSGPERWSDAPFAERQREGSETTRAATEELGKLMK